MTAEANTIDAREVEAAIDKAKRGKAPGTDMISNNLYKWGKPLTTVLLTEVFQMAYNKA